MQTDVYIKIINEKMNMEFWMAGFLVIPKVYAVIASPFRCFGGYLVFSICFFSSLADPMKRTKELASK